MVCDLRRFREHLRSTPHARILAHRLREADRLLTHTHLSLATIAERCGFNSAEYLSVAFRRAHGCPPGEFRRRRQSER